MNPGALNSGVRTHARAEPAPGASPVALRNDLLMIGGICCLLAILGWIVPGVVLRVAPAHDFMVFHTAARAYIEGNLPLLFDGVAFTARLNDSYTDWGFQPLAYRPWVYPPSFLLMVIPIGFLPFLLAYGIFLAITFALLILAIRCYAPHGYPRWLCAGCLLLSPATADTVTAGQNSFLTTALLVGGFGLVRRSPLLGGGLLGLLTCKPQFWLLVPVALVAARKWKALASAIATAGLLALASLATFGIEPWREWLTLMLGQGALYQQWLLIGRNGGQSIYTDACLSGASAGVANLLQGVVTLSCAALVWWCFRFSGMRRDLRIALLLTATILAAPHVAPYDAVMLTLAVSLFLCRAVKDGFRHGDVMLIVAVWGTELLNPPILIRWGLVTPLVLCAFIAVLIARGRSDTAVRAGTPIRSPAGWMRA